MYLASDIDCGDKKPADCGDQMSSRLEPSERVVITAVSNFNIFIFYLRFHMPKTRCWIITNKDLHILLIAIKIFFQPRSSGMGCVPHANWGKKQTNCCGCSFFHLNLKFFDTICICWTFCSEERGGGGGGLWRVKFT